MSGLGAQLRTAIRTNAQDPVLRNSSLILLTTLMGAGAGAVFYVIAARLAPTSVVGLAMTLVGAGESIAVLAQLGMDVVLIRTLQTSDRKAADVAAGVVLVGAAASVLTLGYVLLLPTISPPLAALFTVSWTIGLAVLVAGTAVNQLTDGLFLAIDRVVTNLWINGVLLGLVKCALPFALAGLGALGLYASVGVATFVAGVVSVVALYLALRGRVFQRPSQVFVQARHFAGAGYLTNILYLAPQLVFPILIINSQGASQSAHYLVGFQIVTMLNALIYALCNSMYAEGARRPHAEVAIVRRAGTSLLLAVSGGAAVLVVLAPWLLQVFGQEYRDYGTVTLRLLALGSLGVALNFWAAFRLRLAGHKRAMVSVQLFTTVLMLTLAIALVHLGIEWVALAWGGGQLVGGLVGVAVARRVTPLDPARDSEGQGEGRVGGLGEDPAADRDRATEPLGE